MWLILSMVKRKPVKKKTKKPSARQVASHLKTVALPKQIITKDWTMGEIAERYPRPEVLETISRYGLHCVGCHISAWETLEQGVLGHGLTETDVEKLVRELNEAVAKTEPKKKPAKK